LSLMFTNILLKSYFILLYAFFQIAGKTLQSISICAYLHEFQNCRGPHLVMVPKSTLSNWCNEFKRFCPVIRVLR